MYLVRVLAVWVAGACVHDGIAAKGLATCCACMAAHEASLYRSLKRLGLHIVFVCLQAILGLILVKELVLVDETSGTRINQLHLHEMPFLR